MTVGLATPPLGAAFASTAVFPAPPPSGHSAASVSASASAPASALPGTPSSHPLVPRLDQLGILLLDGANAAPLLGSCFCLRSVLGVLEALGDADVDLWAGEEGRVSEGRGVTIVWRLGLNSITMCTGHRKDLACAVNAEGRSNDSSLGCPAPQSHLIVDDAAVVDAAGQVRLCAGGGSEGLVGGRSASVQEQGALQGESGGPGRLCVARCGVPAQGVRSQQ